jgi:non-heme chloroperoxidase
VISSARTPSSDSRRVSRGTFTASDGEQLYYQDVGDGSALLFVHGWAMNSDFWERQVARLAPRDHRCVTYDQRGCGRSSPALRGYDLDTLADDLAALIETLDLNDLTLVAHSMGSAIVARYLSRHPSLRVAGVVVVSGTLPGIFTEAGSRLHALSAQTHELIADRPAFVRAMAVPFFAPEAVSAETIAWGCNLALRTALHAALEYTRINIETDVAGDMAAFTMPTLIIHGSADAAAPFDQSAARAHALVRASELRIYEGASHGLPLTRAADLNADIAAFAAAIAASRTANRDRVRGSAGSSSPEA